MFNNVKDADDYSARFDLTNPLRVPGVSTDSSQAINTGSMESQQRDVWAQELRKAEDRAQMFKDQVGQLEQKNRDLMQQLTFLEDKVATRDQEIKRL